MKKLLLLFGALTLSLTSCSSDDSSSESTDAVLLKKTILTDSDGEKITTVYTYNGNKIVSMVDDSGDVNLYYTYTDDLITKIEFKLPNGTLEQVNTYTYDSNKRLSVFVRSEPTDKLGSKTVYTYNTDGTVSAKNYRGDDKTQTTLNGESKVFFDKGEVVKITSDYSPNKTFTHDDKFNPMKNVLGMDKLAFEDSDADGVVHNIISEKNSDNNVVTSTYVFTYNAANYPTKSVDTEEGETTTTEYFY
ncbi:hypothetical protein [Flavobacterium foetidum]|uniref:hypothetical protein n=1 Tax=Flavobacterium foetidum TaxID=2026681 RepID=UPI001074DEB8|nr:hypothetical protein [Flavobacterium foetidum]KAF2515202.1 hypothetical protein E0W73_09680 [Flavobacterium foetidum]